MIFRLYQFPHQLYFILDEEAMFEHFTTEKRETNGLRFTFFTMPKNKQEFF